MQRPRLRSLLVPIIIFICLTAFFAYHHTLTFTGSFLSLIGIIAITLASTAVNRGPWL